MQGVCDLIRIAIVEDDDAYRRQLVDFLKRYESESGESFRLSLFSDGMEIVQDYRSEYDIILMDIEMRYMDGMTASSSEGRTRRWSSSSSPICPSM